MQGTIGLQLAAIFLACCVKSSRIQDEVDHEVLAQYRALGIDDRDIYGSKDRTSYNTIGDVKGPASGGATRMSSSEYTRNLLSASDADKTQATINAQRLREKYSNLNAQNTGRSSNSSDRGF